VTGAFEESQVWCLQRGFGWCQHVDSYHAAMISSFIHGVSGGDLTV
jgi:hypothetical protein